MSSFHGNLGSNCSKFIEKLILKTFDLKDLEARLWLKRSILKNDRVQYKYMYMYSKSRCYQSEGKFLPDLAIFAIVPR